MKFFLSGRCHLLCLNIYLAMKRHAIKEMMYCLQLAFVISRYVAGRGAGLLVISRTSRTAALFYIYTWGHWICLYLRAKAGHRINIVFENAWFCRLSVLICNKRTKRKYRMTCEVYHKDTKLSVKTKLNFITSKIKSLKTQECFFNNRTMPPMLILRNVWETKT